MHHDAKRMIAVEIRGRRWSLCQVRTRLAQTGGSVGHRHFLATSFSSQSTHCSVADCFCVAGLCKAEVKLTKIVDPTM